MNNVKPINIPLASHFNLSSCFCPSNDEEKEYMSRVPYDNLVGSLMYMMLCTRLYISHIIGVVRRYMENLGKEHWEVVKWVLRYLRGTSNYCITFNGSSDVIYGYVNLDFAGDLDKRICTSRYVFTLERGLISCMLKLQKHS